MKLNQAISEKFETLRKEKGLKVYALCKKAAISYETYRSIRKNKNKDIQMSTVFLILQALEVTPMQFFSDPVFNTEELDVDFK